MTKNHKLYHAPLNANLALPILLFIFVIIEILCTTSWIFHNNRYVISGLYFICGLAISILPMLKVKDRSNFYPIRNYRWISPTFFIAVAAFICYHSNNIFREIPINYRVADMLPIMKIMSQRFLDGDDVYAIIPEIWEGMQPIYLPAMWMPFTIPTAFNIDVRWACSLALIIGIFLVLKSIDNPNKPIGMKSLLVYIPIVFIVWGIMKEDFVLLPMSEELVVVFYYALLAYSVHQQKAILIAVSLCLCALSRYSLLPWAIMFMVYYIFWIDSRKAITIGISSVVLGLLLMLISGAFKSIDVFINLQQDYLYAIKNSQPYYESVINNSLGLAKFVNYGQLHILHNVHLLISFIIPFVLLLIFISNRQKLNVSFFAICSLKFSLVIFYNLLIVPYSYLFYTSTFISLLILAFYVHQINTEKNIVNQLT